jgi:hypothetical protein
MPNTIWDKQTEADSFYDSTLPGCPVGLAACERGAGRALFFPLVR